jgi:hypothetical protein
MIHEQAPFFSQQLLQALFDPSLPFDIAQAILICEQQRLCLLDRLHSLLDEGEEDDERDMNWILTTLRSPDTQGRSCLPIAQAYLSCSKIGELTRACAGTNATVYDVLHMLHAGNEDQPALDEKENVVRWILLEMLAEEPALFGGCARQLHHYLLAIEHLLLFFSGIRNRIQEDHALQTLRQGDLLPALRKDAAQRIMRLRKHLPIVFALQRMGLGDILLALPAIADMNETLRQLRVHSPLRITVPTKLAPLIQYLFDDDERVEVYSIETTDMNLYQDSLRSLAYPQPGDEVLVEQGGMVLALGSRDLDPALVRQGEQEGVLFGLISFLNTSPYSDHITELASSDEVVSTASRFMATTFRRAMQRSLSHALGIKIYDDEQRDNLDRLTLRLAHYLSAYTQTTPAWLDVTALHTQPGFEQGYISIIQRGTVASKHLTGNLFSFILTELAVTCQQEHIGVVLITDPQSDKMNLQPFRESARSMHLPYREISIQENVAYSLALLQHARGVIGPDTFLTHAAEYMIGVPVVNLFSSSNSFTFRVDERLLGVEHTLARGTRWDSNLATYPEGELYRHEFVHPFTVLLPTEKAQYHPLIYGVQALFTQRIHESLHQFCTRISARH